MYIGINFRAFLFIYAHTKKRNFPLNSLIEGDIYNEMAEYVKTKQGIASKVNFFPECK